MVFPRYVKLPPVAPDKISQIVRYEAQQNVPFPIEEVVWDYQLIGQDSGELSVLLVAVKEDVVKNLTDCVEAAGLDPVLVDVSPMALYNAVRYNYSDLPGCTMILDMGARSTNVVFVEGSRIFSRSIPVAGQTITKDVMKEFALSFEEAEQLKTAHAFVGFGGAYEGHEVGVADRTSKIVRNVMTKLHAEVVRTINFYRSQQGGSPPSLVLLTGGCSVIPHVNTFLSDKLKIEVDYLNPFRNVSVSASVTGDKIGSNVNVLGEVVGLALRRALSCPVEITLLPPALVSRRVFQRRLPFLSMAAIGLVLIMLVFWMFLHRMRAMAEDRLKMVESRVESLQQPANALGALSTQKDVVSGKLSSLMDLTRERTRWMEILEAVHEGMIEGMWVTGLRVAGEPDKGKDVLVVEGLGFSDKVSHQAITAFATNFPSILKGQGHVADEVRIKKIRPVAGIDYVNEFSIEAALNQKVATGASEESK
jgi:type IV pilus assembly protein PilM